MTIDSGWVKLVKTLVPTAFHKICPFRPTVVFIDGQIKLMAPQDIHTWETYFERQFLNTIEAQFRTGASVVVMGFDDYQFVPTAKAPTQRKRNTHVPTVNFEEGQDLPSRPPSSMSGAMRNRAFKTKVIAFIVRSLRMHYKHETHRSVVVDYVGAPEVLGRPLVLPGVFQPRVSQAAPAPAPEAASEPAPEPAPPPPELKRGECDIKAFAWAELGPLLIVSTDGDFVPLSLVQLERAEEAHQRIVLYRMTTNNAPVKRSSAGAAKRTYEYVDVQKILHCLRREIGHPQPARLFAMFCSLTGCDFAANLPSLGPVRVWKGRHLCKDLDLACEKSLLFFVCKLYLEFFNGKLGGAVLNQLVRDLSPQTAPKTYEAIARSVSRVCTKSRSQASFWPTSRATVHARNVIWTLSYWELLHDYPDPEQTKYGFARIGNAVQYAPE